MNSAKDKDTVNHILKQCFPTANKMKIVRNSVGGENQNFTSEILCLTIEYEQNEQKQSKNLLIKTPRQGSSYTFYEDLKMYNREIIMYGVMIPQMNTVLKNPLTPIHYYTTDSQVLVLEDCAVDSYKSRGKYEFFNVKECYPVLQTLANFHAASYKVRQQNPQILDDQIFQYSLALDLRISTMDTWEPILTELLRRKGESRLLEKFTATLQYLRGDDGEIRSKLGPSNFNFLVLNHGDFRLNNLLLKYDSTGLIKGVKIIDFQTSCWSSPAYDIFYFLLTSVPISVVEEHFETLIDWYLRCLNEKLQKLNCEQKYEKNVFMTDLQKLRALCIFFVVFVASLSAPMTIEQIEESLFCDNDQQIKSYELCLSDEQFTDSTYRWIKYCEKLKVLDATKSGENETKQ